jgi:hypothetical protein
VRLSSSKGFSLIETIVSLGVLTTGILGAAAVLVAGMKNLSSSPSDVTVTQKAAQAMEAVFAARDVLDWTKVRNVNDGGVFLNGAQPVTTPGNDGLVGTGDDGPIETIDMGTGHSMRLTAYTRDIKIQDMTGENGQLRAITITMTYQDGTATRTYVLKSFISAYS